MTPAVRQQVRQLVATVLGDREDRKILTPVLTVMLTTSIQDFERYHDARHAHLNVLDHDILQAWKKQKKAAARGQTA